MSPSPRIFRQRSALTSRNVVHPRRPVRVSLRYVHDTADRALLIGTCEQLEEQFRDSRVHLNHKGCILRRENGSNITRSDAVEASEIMDPASREIVPREPGCNARSRYWFITNVRGCSPSTPGGHSNDSTSLPDKSQDPCPETGLP